MTGDHKCKGSDCESWASARLHLIDATPTQESAFNDGWHFALHEAPEIAELRAENAALKAAEAKRVAENSARPNR
jgi:hypothetical protein